MGVDPSAANPPGVEVPPDLLELLAFLRATHPSFGSVADTLTDLAADDSVSPAVYDRVCDAVFTVLTAWAMKDAVPE